MMILKLLKIVVAVAIVIMTCTWLVSLWGFSASSTPWLAFSAYNDILQFAALLLVGILFLLVGFDKARQNKRRLCLTCGYDLRASTDRCPECGTEFTPSIRVP